MSAAPLNPFASQTVSSLRKIEPPLRWLNDAALRKLIAAFELVEEKPHRCELVQPVLSKGDGYGKSHLLGRLIQELDGRATCVSVAPYHDPLTCWVTLLQSMLSELSQPELTYHLPYPPTALDELAHQLFGFLTVMLADKGMTDTPIPGGLRDDILAGAFEKWDLADPASPLGLWINETLSACEQDAAREAVLVRLLKAATLHPYNDDASAMNWLLVLHRYAGDRTDEDSRQMCLEWILTSQLEIPAESFLQNDEQLAANNLIARQQTLDLLALAKLYRPFLLCFDQIHSLTSSLAKSFGQMLMDLVRAEGAHFSIVTASSHHWESIVLPEFGPDSLPCLAPRMELAGLTREQGRSLAEQRLQSNGDPVELQERFLKKDWLQEQFAQGLLGQRDFLRRCQTRYQELVPEAINPPDDAETAEEVALNSAPLLQEDLTTILAPEETEINLKALSETDEIVASPAVEPPAPAEISDIIVEASPALQEAPVKEQGASSDATSQSTNEPVVETPSPAEISDTLVSETVVSAIDDSVKEQNEVIETPESSPSIEQASTPELVAGMGPSAAPSNLEEPPPASESSTLIPLLPERFSAFTPLVDIIAHQTEGDEKSHLPPVLLPPAQEDFLSESKESSSAVAETGNPTPSLEELADSLAEPDKTAPEETPTPLASSSIGTDRSVPSELAGEAAPVPALPEETAPTTPAASEVQDLQPVSESPVETITPVSPESTGAIPDASLMDEVETPALSAPSAVDAPSISPAPELATPLPTEIELQKGEAEPDTTTASGDIPAAEPLDLVPASANRVASESEQAPMVVSTPDSAATPVPESVIAATATTHDQAELRDALLNIIKAHRFASHIAIADELRRKMQRSVSAEEAVLCAQSISEIHVYADGPNVAFLWQGQD